MSINEYRELIAGIADRLNAINLDAGIELARAASDIAGYGPVKEANAAVYVARLPKLREKFDASTPVPRAHAA